LAHLYGPSGIEPRIPYRTIYAYPVDHDVDVVMSPITVANRHVLVVSLIHAHARKEIPYYVPPRFV
jgi:hypothetical protein